MLIVKNDTLYRYWQNNVPFGQFKENKLLTYCVRKKLYCITVLIKILIKDKYV